MKLSLLSAALAFAPAVLASQKSIQNTHKELNYSSVAGVFLQDDASTDASSFDYVSSLCHDVPSNTLRPITTLAC